MPAGQGGGENEGEADGGQLLECTMHPEKRFGLDPVGDGKTEGLITE